MKVIDHDWKIGASYAFTSEGPDGNWIEGSILTPRGIVTIYAQGGQNSTYYTSLKFVYGGRCYTRNFENKRYSKSGLVRKSNQFTREIACAKYCSSFSLSSLSPQERSSISTGTQITRVKRKAASR